MPRYSEERRVAVVAKLLPPQSLSLQEVAEQEGLSLATVYKWRAEARAKGHCVPAANAQGAEQWSSKDRFAAVLDCASLFVTWQAPLASWPEFPQFHRSA